MDSENIIATLIIFWPPLDDPVMFLQRKYLRQVAKRYHTSFEKSALLRLTLFKAIETLQPFRTARFKRQAGN